MSIARYSTPISSSAQRTANDELPVIWKNSIMNTVPRRSLHLAAEHTAAGPPLAVLGEQLIRDLGALLDVVAAADGSGGERDPRLGVARRVRFGIERRVGLPGCE